MTKTSEDKKPCPWCGLPITVVSQGNMEGKIPYHRQRRVRRRKGGTGPEVYAAERCDGSGEVYKEA